MAQLNVIATPIGNLKDISHRAIEILSNSTIIFCEDTRVMGKLLHLLKIKKPKLIALNDFNESKLLDYALKQILDSQQIVSLTSDAGTPCISDPGFKLIKLAIQHNVFINHIPGASALTMVIPISNFEGYYTFIGFLKPKKLQRLNQIKNFTNGNYVIYISPYKLINQLEEIKTIYPNSQIFLGKELTKKYEKHYRGNILEVLEQIKKESIKGEFTLVLHLI